MTTETAWVTQPGWTLTHFFGHGEHEPVAVVVANFGEDAAIERLKGVALEHSSGDGLEWGCDDGDWFTDDYAYLITPHTVEVLS